MKGGLHKINGIIYRIFNKTNGKSYIGATMNFNTRVSDHDHRLRKGEHPCRDLQKDFNAGHELHCEVLEEVALICEGNYAPKLWDQVELFEAERRQMKRFDNKYNTYDAPINGRVDYRMEPLNEIGTNEWVVEVRGFIDKMRPPKGVTDAQRYRVE